MEDEKKMEEVSGGRLFYLTRSVPLHEYCFFLEKPSMIMLKNGNILWTDAEFACKIYGVQLIMPMLDVPVGKCWLIRVIEMNDMQARIDVIDRDVDVVRCVR